MKIYLEAVNEEIDLYKAVMLRLVKPNLKYNSCF